MMKWMVICHGVCGFSNKREALAYFRWCKRHELAAMIAKGVTPTPIPPRVIPRRDPE